MRVFHINAVPYGSTGRIMFHMVDLLAQKGHESLCTTGFTWAKSGRDNCFITSGLITKRLHMLLAQNTGLMGCFSVGATLKLLRRIRKFRPDVIHMHNLHSWFVNLPMLFRFLKKAGIPVVWTFHDCWALTGHCAYFDMVDCDKWKTGCHHCPQCDEFPETRIDNTRWMWRQKKKWFNGIEKLTVVTPSRWLAGLVKQSYLKDYDIRVINNGIDTAVFRPTDSDFRKKYGCEDQFVILGVSFDWCHRKGLDVFVELAQRLGDRFRIVLVGTNEELDRELPASVISIHRTANAAELAQIYSAADLFLNPTREENYPTVNMEALACGTPVLTFRTGGSPEMLDDTCGCVVGYGDTDAMEQQILRIAEHRPYKKEACLRRAEDFATNDRFQNYIRLYEELITGRKS